MCTDDGSPVGTTGKEWYRQVQEGDRQLLVQDGLLQRGDARRWNHYKTIGGKAAKSAKGPSKDEVQNRVPLRLLLEILEALKG